MHGPRPFFVLISKKRKENAMTKAGGKAQPLLNEQDAANYLAMSMIWLRKGRSEGYGPPFHKIGRAVRYRLEDLDNFANSGRKEFAPNG